MDPSVYDALAREEDHHWWFVGRRAIVGELLAAHLAPRAHRTILDVGCGTGGMLTMLAQLGAVEGADRAEAAIAYARARFPAFAIHQIELPTDLPDRRWDVITAFDVVEHLDDPVACLRALRDHLSPDGELAITVPAYALLWSDHDVRHHHKRRYTRATLADELARAGLRVRYATHFNTWLLPAIAAVRLASRVVPAVRARQHDSVHAPGGALNRALAALFASERFALRRVPLPLGVSIFVVAEPAR